MMDGGEDEMEGDDEDKMVMMDGEDKMVEITWWM